MQDCRCFIYLWAWEGVTRTPEQIIATYNDIAASIVAGVRNPGIIQKTGGACFSGGFDLLCWAYNTENRPSTEIYPDHWRPGSIDDDIVHTAMFLLCSNGGTDALDSLLTGRHVNDRISSGLMTCLHVAATNNHAATVALLLRQGAKVDLESVDGNTAWTMICKREDCEQISTLLLQAGANPNHTIRDSSSRVSPLHMAAAKGDLNTVRLLLRRGTNPSVKASTNWYPLVSISPVTFQRQILTLCL